MSIPYTSVLLKENYFTKQNILLFSIIPLISAISIISIGYIKPFLILLGLAVVVIGIFNTKYFLYLYLFLLPFTFIFKFYIGLTLSQYGLTTFYIAIWLMNVILTKKRINFPPRWMVIFICLFVTWSFVSDLHAGIGILQVRTIASNIIFFIFVIALYDVITVEKYIEMYWVVIIPFIFVFLFTFIKLLAAGSIFSMIYMVLTKGCDDILYPNMIGGIYLLFWPISFAMYLYEKNKIRRIVYLTIAIAFIIGIVLTNTRSAYLGTFVAILYFIWFSKKRMILLGSMGIITLIYLLSPVASIVNELLLRVEAGVSGRDIVWDVAFKLIKENYIFGIGSYTLQMIINYKYPLMTYQNILPLIRNAHNYPINMTLQMGIPGFFFIIYIYYKFARISIMGQLANTDNKIRALCMGSASIMLGMFARGMFEAIGIIDNGVIFPHIYFWVIMLFTVKIFNGEHKKKP